MVFEHSAGARTRAARRGAAAPVLYTCITVASAAGPGFTGLISPSTSTRHRASHTRYSGTGATAPEPASTPLLLRVQTVRTYVDTPQDMLS